MTTQSSTAAVEPITCLSWCESSDGHPNQLSRADQSCLGAQHRVALSTASTSRQTDGSSPQGYATTYLTQQADQLAPRIFIGHDQGSGVLATLEEARRFALEILTLVDRQRDRKG